MTLGIIGVGHLASALLAGLLHAGHSPGAIMLSPRGQGPALAARHGFALADDNAGLVRHAETVLLAVRPAGAAAALRGLPWRRGQTLASACAGVPIAELEAAAAPASVMRIMPITAAALGASPTLVYPDTPALSPLLSAWGRAIPLADEAQFEAATVSAAIYGWAQALIRDSTAWAAASGVEQAAARSLMARTFVAAGRMIDEQDAAVDDLLAQVVTPGGITEAGLRHLDESGMPEAWRGACDAVLRRLRDHS